MNKKIAKKRVLVAMSGGVDSSVAAFLLVRSKKFDVSGAFMVNYDNNLAGSESCYIPDYRDALRVAAALKIPLFKLDFQKDYREKVLGYLFAEYEKGRTPNPDVLCNSYIKFGSWIQKAKELGFDYIATGHYARLNEDNNGFHLFQSKDKNKDQTYFLHQLNQEQLGFSLFPLGNHTKEEVRKIAQRASIPTAQKAESMGICFVGEVPMKEFLSQTLKPNLGKIVTSSGQIIGEHRGLPFYTIGERHIGIQGTGSKPVFVLDKNFENNLLVVGNENDEKLYKAECEIDNVNWIQKIKFPIKCEVRLRHRQSFQKCEIKIVNGKLLVKFISPQKAVTPGQFAVFYKKGECLGGGAVK